MAILKNKELFFTTSPRTPTKMIPEIKLLADNFTGQKWDKTSQIGFMDILAKSDFFEGSGSKNNMTFSARDRITRAPKALGFVDLKPTIQLTSAGNDFVNSKRPQEIFLRQLLKFQLPSVYHTENKSITGTFHIRPYLEIMRLIRELGKLTFDELKIFALHLTDYRQFNQIKEKILLFRKNKVANRGKYKKFAMDNWNAEICEVYAKDIAEGKTKTRQTKDDSLKTFLKTKRSNLRDYADACFRYLRYTGLITISQKGRSLSFFEDKSQEVDFILSTVERAPVFLEDTELYKSYLFDAKSPMIYTDDKDVMINLIMKISELTHAQLEKKHIEDLKDLRDDIIKRKKEVIVKEEVARLKSYALYSEIIDTYHEILHEELFDKPLMLEWNTWRAMTMLNGGVIKGNFRIDDMGAPMSTAVGNMPDIECDYNDFMLSVEVTLQSGQRQYEAEGEPVARHYGQLKKRANKDTYCVFVAPTINHATLAHFYMLNKIEIEYYGGKSKIIPLELDVFMKLIESSYTYSGQPTSVQVRELLEQISNHAQTSKNENEWFEMIDNCVSNWLVA